MTKKRLFITIMASFVLCASFVFSSCNKEDDSVPTIEEYALLLPKSPYAVCRHCGGNINEGETHVHYFLPTESCADSVYCVWYGCYHRHIVHYPTNSHKIHIGGYFRP